MKKKIIPIIALSLIALVAIATVVMACITSSYRPNIDAPDYITFSADSYQQQHEGDEVYNKVVEKFDSAFEESALNALFQGRLNESDEVVELAEAKKLSSISDYIRFEYKTARKINYENTEISYRSLIVELNSNQAISEVKIYILEQGETSEVHYYISSIANYAELNEYYNQVNA